MSRLVGKARRLINFNQRRGFSSGYSLEGHLVPRINPKAWVAHNAVVVGDVEIGADSSVWFSAIIRGDRHKITIGDRCNVQDGSVLHTDPGVPLVLEDGVTIGHMVMLHGCTVRKGSLVGIGATVLNKAEIGPNCLIGAGALVTEGKVIPEGSLVIGTNKVVRKLTPIEIEGLQKTANGYVSNKERYRNTMQQVQEDV